MTSLYQLAFCTVLETGEAASTETNTTVLAEARFVLAAPAGKPTKTSLN